MTRRSERAWRTPWLNRGRRVCEGCGFYLLSLSLSGNSEDHQKISKRRDNWKGLATRSIVVFGHRSLYSRNHKNKSFI